ncbi:hypothetical protein JAAARDRAFT_194636 [Jaapia argillacea MUCL 33604]|uniref:F-box domain-containing protein n=1 Tax=Jaapia argillacea MUCL 33604 TaxID=933084 RepID=A0A067PS44_9AGAM|nr:hypothetical protein JAAARDRAFT_194636 [Jaapia argillacea MUCL 33604]
MLTLPLELVNSIIDRVDNPADILALALTCRLLKEILIPYILDYRELHVDWRSSAALWIHLVCHPAFGQNVRKLHVHRNSRALLRVPRITEEGNIEGSDAEAIRIEDTFFQALKLMSGLVSFTWDLGWAYWKPADFNSLFEILGRSCPMLTSMDFSDIVDSQSKEAKEEGLARRYAGFCSIRNIETFRYELIINGPKFVYGMIAPTYIVRFLSTNPFLRIVRLAINKGDSHESTFDSCFGDVLLPSLHTLEIGEFDFADENTFPRFLSRNPSIVVLKTEYEFAAELLSLGDLPNLREFDCLGDCWVDLCLVKPPLRVLNGVWIDGEEYGVNSRGFQALKAASSTLETIHIWHNKSLQPDLSWVTVAVPTAVIVRH